MNVLCSRPPKGACAALAALLVAAGVVACGGGAGEGSTGSGAAESVTKTHHDSGGGSKQFIEPNQDNNVQEFGVEASLSEFGEAALALHGFLDARAEGDWAAACSQLARRTVESLERLAARAIRGPSDCDALLSHLAHPAAGQTMEEEARQADAGSLRAEGNRGFVIYRGAGNAIMAMPMAREDGAWKVAGLAGALLY